MTVFKDIIPIAKKIIGKYYLCDFCLGRLFSKKLNLSSEKILGKKLKKEIRISQKKCYICKDLFENIPTYLEKMKEVSNEYHFSSFVVGTKIQPSIVDRDDSIRSRFQIRGADGIKTGITREISKEFSKKTKKKMEFLDPEVTFTIDLKEQTCKIRSKNLIFQGRYIKNQRGLPQKQKSCENCNGKGCGLCKFHGISNYESIEGKISDVIFKKFGGTVAKFTWIGGEDKSSLVLGSGRPFFTRLQNPKKRKSKFPKILQNQPVKIHNLKIISDIPKLPLNFTSLIQILISTDHELSSSHLNKLHSLSATPIIISENSGKKSEKQIYDVSYKKKSKNQFILRIKADGGLSVKRFVLGENVVPSVSQLLDTDCKCVEFDFLDIQMITNN